MSILLAGPPNSNVHSCRISTGVPNIASHGLSSLSRCRVGAALLFLMTGVSINTPASSYTDVARSAECSTGIRRERLRINMAAPWETSRVNKPHVVQASQPARWRHHTMEETDVDALNSSDFKLHHRLNSLPQHHLVGTVNIPKPPKHFGKLGERSISPTRTCGDS